MTEEIDIWTEMHSYVDPADQIELSFRQFNITVCLKVGRSYRNRFFRNFVTLTDGTIVIWIVPAPGLLTHKRHFKPTWEYYNYIQHFIITSAGLSLTHDH